MPPVGLGGGIDLVAPGGSNAGRAGSDDPFGSMVAMHGVARRGLMQQGCMVW